MAGETEISLLVRAKDFTKRGLRTADRGLRSFAARTRARFTKIRKSIFSVRTALGAIAGAAALGTIAKKTFDLGSEVEETASKYRTVFGPAVAEVNEFLDDFAHKAGLSRMEAQEVAATTGAIVQGMGASAEASARMSEEILKLSGDLTSFNNIPIEETSRAIQAALTGEREQLKRLGIVVRETDVQERALANTGKETAKALTQQERATATLEIITERAGKAVGDLNRTQRSAANRARRVASEFRTLKEVTARAMLPVLETLLDVIDSLNFLKLAAAIETDVGQAFLNLGIVAGAKMGEGLFRGLAKVMRESNILAKIPGPVGDFFDRINLGAAGVEKIADIAADSAQHASEAIDILANASGNLDRITQDIEKARQRLAQAQTGGGGGGGGEETPEDVTISGGFRGERTVGTNTDLVEATGIDRYREHVRNLPEDTSKAEEAMASFGSTAAQAFGGALTGALLAADGMREGFLGSLAEMAAGKGAFYLAEAAAALAQGILGDPRGFAAAKQYAVSAGMMFALAGALGGAASAVSGGGGGGVAGGARSAAGRQADQSGGAAQPGGTIVVKGGILDMNDPRQARAFAAALENMTGRDITVVGG